jgi:hypothetical protein
MARARAMNRKGTVMTMTSRKHPGPWELRLPVAVPSPSQKGSLSPFDGESDWARGRAPAPWPTPIHLNRPDEARPRVGTDDAQPRKRSGVRLTHDEPRERLMKPQPEDRGTRGGTHLQVTGWLVNTKFVVAVRYRPTRGALSTLEKTHYVKLAPGIPNHRPPGSAAGLHRNRRTRRLGG